MDQAAVPPAEPGAPSPAATGAEPPVAVPAVPGEPPAPECTSLLEHGLAELHRTFDAALGAETVDRLVAESYRDLAASSTDVSHRESITLRFAQSRLEAFLATGAGGSTPHAVPRVLFVCVQNAGRSQLAAALLAERAGDAVRVASAGSRPASQIHANVSPVLREIGQDPADTYPKPLSPELLAAADYVITLGCGDQCDVAPGTQVRDWPVGDPAEADWDRLQEIVKDIEERVEDLWREIRRD